MPIQRFILCVSCCVFLIAGASHAQWMQTSCPTDVYIFAFATRDANLYAATDKGVLLSSDNGMNWISRSVGLADSHVSCLAVVGNHLFAGARGFTGGVFRSTDNDTSWTAVNDGLSNRSVSCFAVSDTNLYVGTAGGVFVSTNHGDSWTVARSGLRDTMVNCLTSHNGYLFAGTHDGVYCSTNNGVNWFEASSGLTYPYVNCFETIGGDLYAGTDQGVFGTSDNASNWSLASAAGLTDSTVRSFAKSGRNLFAGTFDGVFLSTDGGARWRSTNVGLPPSADIFSLAVYNNYIFAGAPGLGVWRRMLPEMIVPSASESRTVQTPTMSVYPNPAHDVICVRCNGYDIDSEIILFDALGNAIVFQRSNITTNQSLDASTLRSGIYRVTWRRGTTICAQPIAIMH